MSDIDIAHLTDRFMRRIHAALNTDADSFDVHNLGPGGGILLLTLAEIAPAPMHQLATQMARDKSQITRTVRSMEDKGLVERRGDPDDGRSAILQLTPLGQDAVLGLQRAVAKALTGILAPLTQAEQDTLRELLRRL
ncbi:MAG: MarR family transcriptional regulator [Jannaschia sp.]